ncbi:ABC transporter substrate-binding protein [Rhodococcus rhodochrous]|uniref:ABC transporter substrate-binding protein n=1 Tax=Rhodococcus rhodochrous TaxID=1829 RepID=A0AAW4XPZ8_RHORH|nr:ABC transporter substrate-binding protein [Rhodococcus rhodochrous]MCD2114864.1 ABC transporter substrate-binding protein [Rhodococcus rhodochrous]
MPSLTRTRRRRTFAAVIIAVAATLAAACAGAADGVEKSAAGDEIVKIGMLPIAGAAPLKVVQTQDFISDQGLIGQEVNLRTPADTVPNLLNGTTNVGALNVGSLAQALAERVDLRILSTLYYANDDMSIFSMKNSGITQPKELEGKKIGLIQLENTNHAALVAWLQERGVDTSTIKFVLVPVTDMPAALRSGQVDAGQVLYPLAQTMIDDLTPVVPNLLEAFGHQPVQGYVIASGKFVDQNPDTVARIQTALEQANEFLTSDPAASIAAIHAVTDVPDNLLRDSKLPAFGNDLKLASSQAQIDLMIEQGFLEKSVDLSSAVFTKGTSR